MIKSFLMQLFYKVNIDSRQIMRLGETSLYQNKYLVFFFEKSQPCATIKFNYWEGSVY